MFPNVMLLLCVDTHVLLTRTSRITPFDLHVLYIPPAFILSHDQTLQKNLKFQKEIKI